MSSSKSPSASSETVQMNEIINSAQNQNSKTSEDFSNNYDNWFYSNNNANAPNQQKVPLVRKHQVAASTSYTNAEPKMHQVAAPSSYTNAEPNFNNENNNDVNPTSNGYGCCDYLLIGLSCLIGLLFLPIFLIMSIKITKEYERAVVMRLGRLAKDGARGPGIFWVLPCTDTFHIVDLRTQTFDCPSQEILTRDSVTVTVDAVCYFRTFDPVLAVLNVENAVHATQQLAATTLRSELSMNTLQEILREKDKIAQSMQIDLDRATCIWGIKIERVELKDVKLPNSMQRAMAKEAEATRDAKAKIISAEGDQKSSYALKEAGDIINQNPVALQLRYLQTLSQMATNGNSTLLFPMPLDILTDYKTKR